MKHEIKGKSLILYPDPSELVLGVGAEALPENLSGSPEEILIDLRRHPGLSTGGLEWILKVVSLARKEGLKSYLVASEALKQLLESTEIVKIVEIHVSTHFQRNSLRDVENLEKDLLWNVLPEDLQNG